MTDLYTATSKARNYFDISRGECGECLCVCHLYLWLEMCNLTMRKIPGHYVKGYQERDLNSAHLLSPSSLLRVVNFRCYGKVVNRVQVFIVLFVATTLNTRRSLEEHTLITECNLGLSVSHILPYVKRSSLPLTKDRVA